LTRLGLGFGFGFGLDLGFGLGLGLGLRFGLGDGLGRVLSCLVLLFWSNLSYLLLVWSSSCHKMVLF
jgi:hypothetical protein